MISLWNFSVVATKTALASLAFYSWIQLSKSDGVVTRNERIKAGLLFIVILAEALA